MNENNSTGNVKSSNQWSRAYYSILGLSLFLIPVTTYLACLSLDTVILNTWNGDTLSDVLTLPALTAWYVVVGTTVLVYIAASRGLIILAVALFR